MTQPRAFGAFTGRGYGSFADRSAAAPEHPVVRLTQARAFGAFAGRRYGSFADRAPSGEPPTQVVVGPSGGRPMRFRVPRALRNEDEEILLIISAALQVLDIN